MRIQQVTLSTLADFVRGQIAVGCTALSSVVSRTIDVSAGRLFLIMPEGLVPNRIENWDWDPGGVKAEAADRTLARIVRAYLRRERSRVIIQDFEARRSDPSYTDDPLRVFHGEELYWELEGLDLPEDKIISCIRDASYWPWLCYFCKVRAGKGRLLDEHDLHEVASHLVGAAAQALHDSYVVWWRTDLEPFPVRPE